MNPQSYRREQCSGLKCPRQLNTQPGRHAHEYVAAGWEWKSVPECKSAAGRDRGRLAGLSTRGQLQGLDQYWQAGPLPRVRKPSCSHLTAIFPAHYLHGAAPGAPGCSGQQGPQPTWGIIISIPINAPLSLITWPIVPVPVAWKAANVNKLLSNTSLLLLLRIYFLEWR